MTVYLRDASHYDGPLSYTGLAGLTTKSTEGTTSRDDTYAGHINGGKAAGVPVLGAYHVVRTPGNGGNGTLAAQLAYWVAWMDGETSWWRSWPHWILQIDAEHWPYDVVSASTVLQFADMLSRSGLPGWKVTYASRGQYGDTLKGIKTPLWNAAYGTNTGVYPGDNAAAWAPYSGQTPTLLQYASTGYDHDAYRGSLAELLALTGGDDYMDAATEAELMRILRNLDSEVYYGLTLGHPTIDADLTMGDKSVVHKQPFALATTLAAIKNALANPVPVQVDAAAVADALGANPGFLKALAKAVNDDAAARLAS